MYDKEKFFFFCEYLESVILLKVSTLSRMNVSSSATIREKDRKWLYDYVDDDDVMWDEKRVNIKKKLSRIRRILRAYTHIFFTIWLLDSEIEVDSILRKQSHLEVKNPLK